MREKLEIGLIGTVTYDKITSDAGDVYRGLGGILYQASVLSALEKHVFLFTNLGRDLISPVGRATVRWDTFHDEGIRYVPGPGNQVHLYYPKNGERQEILDSVVPPLDPKGILARLNRLRMLVFVINSGFDITLSDWRRVVDAADCPIWVDMHSLVLSRELKTPRKFLSEVPWKDWARGVTYLQLNKAELGCLLGRVGQDFPAKEIELFGQSAFDLGLQAVFLTLGSDGVRVITPEHDRLLIPSRAAKVKDTTGCGDVFCAVTVKELADGMDLFSAAKAGVELATLATTVKGVGETFELVRRAIKGL